MPCDSLARESRLDCVRTHAGVPMILTCPSCDTKFRIPPKALGTDGRKVKCKNCGNAWFQRPEGAEGPAETTPSAAHSSAAVDEMTHQAGAPLDDDFDGGFQEKETPPPLPSLEALGRGDEEAGEGEGEDDAADEAAVGGRLGWLRRLRRRRSRGGDRPHRSRFRAGHPAGWGALVAGVAALVAVVLLAPAALVGAWPPTAHLYETIGMPVPVPGAGLRMIDVTAERRNVGGATIVVLEGEIRNETAQEATIPTLAGFLLDSDGVVIESWAFTTDTEVLAPGASTIFTEQYAPSALGAAFVGATVVAAE